MKKALIIVDYQYDFAAPDGRLTAGEPAAKIQPRIIKLAEQYPKEDIYFTLDDHSESDWQTDIFPEPKVFPPHCIRGTAGYEIYGEIKGKENSENHMRKHAYCPNAEDVERLAEGYDELTVVGLVTDICVLQTVIGLYTYAVNNAKKLRLIVDSSACASFNPEREEFALTYMREVLGLEII